MTDLSGVLCITPNMDKTVKKDKTEKNERQQAFGGGFGAVVKCVRILSIVLIKSFSVWLVSFQLSITARRTGIGTQRCRC